MLIVLSGKARSGKDTVAKALQKVFLLKNYIGYYTRAYADELKEMLARDLDLTYDQLYGEFKEVEDKRYPKDNGYYWTPREFLQYFGTDIYRNIDSLFWVKKLQKFVKEKGINCIITDARFKNEIDWVQNKGGIYLNVERSVCGAKQGKNHKSETSLDTAQSDYTVMNNSDSIDELELYLEKEVIPFILKKFKMEAYNA